MKIWMSVLVLLCGLLPAPAALAAPPHHRLEIRLDPEQHRLAGEDQITLPAPQPTVGFALHAGLKPESPTPGVTLHRVPGPEAAGFPAGAGFGVEVEWYRADLPPGTRTFTREVRRGGPPPPVGRGDLRPGVPSDPGDDLGRRGVPLRLPPPGTHGWPSRTSPSISMWSFPPAGMP